MSIYVYLPIHSGSSHLLAKIVCCALCLMGLLTVITNTKALANGKIASRGIERRCLTEPGNITVTGIGSCGNGTYLPNGTVNGAPAWQATASWGDVYTISYNTGTWELRAQSGTVYASVSGSTSGPPCNGWSSQCGTVIVTGGCVESTSPSSPTIVSSVSTFSVNTSFIYCVSSPIPITVTCPVETTVVYGDYNTGETVYQYGLSLQLGSNSYTFVCTNGESSSEPTLVIASGNSCGGGGEQNPTPPSLTVITASGTDFTSPLTGCVSAEQSLTLVATCAISGTAPRLINPDGTRTSFGEGGILVVDGDYL